MPQAKATSKIKNTASVGPVKINCGAGLLKCKAQMAIYSDSFLQKIPHGTAQMTTAQKQRSNVWRSSSKCAERVIFF